MIPINDRGQLLINYMGIASSASPQGHQTFTVRSFSGYASRVPSPDPNRWPRTMGVGNKILMVGPFSKGIAEDEKTTPYGLMFGVEIHATAAANLLRGEWIVRFPHKGEAVVLNVFIFVLTLAVFRLRPLMAGAALVLLGGLWTLLSYGAFLAGLFVPGFLMLIVIFPSIFALSTFYYYLALRRSREFLESRLGVRLPEGH